MDILRIIKINLRHNFLPHLLIAVLIAFLTPAAFQISALDFRSSAQPLEMLLSLSGAVLFTPVFLPEQNVGIRDTVRSKKADYLGIYALRAAYSAVFLAVLIGMFAAVMKLFECNVTVSHFAAGYASAMFLGAVGFAAAGITGSATAGYMAAMMYYIANFGLKDKLGIFFIFNMYFSGSSSSSPGLITASVCIIMLTLLWLKIRDKV